MARKSEKCKFNFSVYWDEHGYFVNLCDKGGNNIHNSHPKHHNPSNIPILTRLLNEDEEETVNHVVESACNKAAGRNYMFKRFGKFISSMKVAYLNQKNNQDDDVGGDDIDSMLANFEKSDEIRFTTLSDIPRSELLIALTSLETQTSPETQMSPRAMIPQTKMIPLPLPLQSRKTVVLSTHPCLRYHQYRG